MKKASGTYGNPNVTYHGPGLHHLLDSGYETKFDEKTGKVGIVLGKYTRTNTSKKRQVSFKEEEIAAADSEMYKDAMALALASGQGYSEINYNDYEPFEGM